MSRSHRRARPGDRANVALPVGVAAVAVSLGLLTLVTPAPELESEPAADPQPTPDTTPEPSPSPPASAHPELPDPSPTPVILRSMVREVDTADGELVRVPGESPVLGDGPLRRFTVEVEEGLPGRASDFAAAVEEVLADPRSWGGDGEMSFQRVEEPPVDFRVALAAPDTTDRLCAPLRTNGELSCHQGGRAVINQNRWVSGVPHFDGDMETYRIYVLNHEIGHALGHGHRPCPGDGERAPVMQQQTLRLDGCEPNGWPNP